MKFVRQFAVRIVLMLGMFMLVAGSLGCRAYPKPMIEEIDTHETAYLIDLEGMGDQVKFASVDQLEKQKIAAKRVEIPLRWLQTGRAWFDGQWIPQQRLIKVNRTPVARRWTGDLNTGTSKVIQLLEAESKDSVGVKSGFAITAYVEEADTSKFLYRFPTGDLAAIIDNQVFNDVQAVYAKIAAQYDVRDLREKKEEINEAIRKEVLPAYAKDGITIKPSLGLIGGLTYDNPDIQKSIDQVFMAQTLEAKATAELASQIKENERALSIEKNDAEKRKVKADAEAYEIDQKAKAILAGGTGYIELLRLEVAKVAMEKWDGKYPTTFSGGSTLNHLLMGPAADPLPIIKPPAAVAPATK
jgi:hypothetical protein